MSSEWSNHDKNLVVMLKLLGTSYSCYNNNFITKLWSPDINFSIYTQFSWHCFLEQFSMFSSIYETQVRHSTLLWKFQTNWVDTSTQFSRVIHNTLFFRFFASCQMYKQITTVSSLKISHLFFLSYPTLSRFSSTPSMKVPISNTLTCKKSEVHMELSLIIQFMSFATYWINILFMQNVLDTLSPNL